MIDSSHAFEQRRRAFAILREALDITGDSERESWLERRCGGDQSLLHEVRAMLRAESPRLFEADASAIAARLVEEDALFDPLPPGTRLGDWTIVRPLGHGGMGTVHLAERTGDGFRQRGALKLIRRGMDSAAVRARLRRERQIQSQLEHPNIARLLDSGISAEGQPYFVMEYVDGQTLRQWSLRDEADLAARLAVFLQLGDAVAHAHKHLVVHRDIKPENVLVAADGHARLLDFGIAKLLEPGDAAEHTMTQGRFLSRAYAAPEQIDGDVVTTATDVYQLGVLLFELLTGARFGAVTAAAGGVSGWLARAQVEGDAATRRVVPAARLRGDASIVVARATDADPKRRYATVEALCADVRAWRDGLPVTARADSTAYRVRRFVGRQRVATLAAALALAAILAGSGMALWQARKASDEAKLARSAQAFLTSVFDASAPNTAAGERVTARELLDRGSERLATELADQPRLRGEMQLTLGGLYAQLGQYTQASRLLGDARSALTEREPDAAVRATLELAAVQRELGQLDESDRWLDTVADVREPTLRSRALAERALTREKQGRFDEALTEARAALAVDLARGPDALADQARDRQIEALLLARQARFEEASKIFELAIAGARKVRGDEDTRVAEMLNDYGSNLSELGRSDEAEAALRRALEIRRKRLGNEHPAVAESLQVLAAILRSRGRLEETQGTLEEALRIQRTVFGDHHAIVANTLNSLGMLDFTRRRPADAEARFREAIAIYRELALSDTPQAATAANNLATVLTQLGRYDEAEPLMRGALDVHLKTLGEQHPAVMSDLNSLGQLEMRRGHLEAAVDYARRSVAIVDAGAAPPRAGAYTRVSYANVLAHAGRFEAALEQVERAIAVLEGIDPSEWRLPIAHEVRADALLGLGRNTDARAAAERALEQRERLLGTDVEGLALSHALVARVAAASGDNATVLRERGQVSRLVATVTAPSPYLLRELSRR